MSTTTTRPAGLREKWNPSATRKAQAKEGIAAPFLVIFALFITILAGCRGFGPSRPNEDPEYSYIRAISLSERSACLATSSLLKSDSKDVPRIVARAYDIYEGKHNTEIRAGMVNGAYTFTSEAAFAIMERACNDPDKTIRSIATGWMARMKKEEAAQLNRWPQPGAEPRINTD